MKSEVEVPAGWELVELSDVAEINKGLSYKSKDYGTRDDGIIFINLKCILKGGGFNRRGIKYYKGGYKNEHLVKSGDIIIANTDLTRNGDIVGAPIFVPNLNGKTCISMDLSSLNFRGEIIDKKYGYYYLCQGNIREFMRKNSSGSTVLHLNLQAVKKLKFLLPPIEEQQKIADILSKVDEQIDFTGKIIDKTEKLKKGLMRKLLTKGIGHTTFVKTEFGEMPTGWIIKKLSEIVDSNKTITYGIVQAGPNVENGIPYIRSGDLNDININADNLPRTSFEIADKYKRSEVGPGDIIFSLRGNIGTTKIVPNDISRANLTQGTARISCNSDINNKFVNFMLNSNLIKKRINAVTKGCTFREITLKELRKLKIPIPKIEEQKQIASILSKVDEHIQDNKKELNHLQELKKGLMQDLLTGKVRVSV